MAAKRTLSDNFEPLPVQSKKPRIGEESHLTSSFEGQDILHSLVSTEKSEPTEEIQVPPVKVSSGSFSLIASSMPGIRPVKPSMQVSSLSTQSSSPSVISLPTQALSPIGFPIPINRPVGLPIHLTSANLPSGIKVTRIPTPAAIPSAHYISPLQTGPTLLRQGLGSVQASSSSTSSSFPAILPPPYSVTTSVANLIPVGEAIELTCSSPSQFLHSPLKVSSAVPLSSASLNTSSGIINVNRQPICSVDPKPIVSKAQSNNKNMRSRILKKRRAKLTSIKLKYDIMLREQFFMEEGGNIMDFIHWKKKPNLLRDQFLKQHDLSVEIVSCKHQDHSSNFTTTTTTSLPTATTIQIPLSTVSPSLHPTPPKGSSGTPNSPSKSTSFPSLTRRSTRAYASFSSVYENSHEDIVMRARHEAEVMKAISELRKEGLWSAIRLPRVQEPPRIKTHWDYLLEEMQWLATDFANEKKWKINAARKLSRSVAHYHKESGMQQARTEKEELLRLRKIASSIAKEVKHFWDSMQKIVEHKRNILLEAKRKKAMDLHLEFIVDQTAKYSDWLAKGLGSNAGSVGEPSLHSAASCDDSDAFISPPEESDDENTIAIEEQTQIEEGGVNYDNEIDQLQREGEMPLDELLAFLPKEILGGIEIGSDMTLSDTESKTQITDRNNRSEVSVDYKKRSLHTAKYQLSSCDEEVCMEDETTIEEQEFHEEEIDHDEEINELLKEGELPLEELLDKYNMQQQYSVTPDSSGIGSPEVFSEGSDRSSDLDNSLGNSDDAEEDNMADEEGNGLESLMTGVKLEEACKTEAGLSDVVAAAERFQPKGITLATTDVETAVPFLLKHTLREYQHIGLDWLVTMYERRLNGILADEMGLGKTIQTIALLAHLVCEKGIWGPHLIIVPTSVLLNWEYELKKWCPALKILTYFGSLKERKQKRIGWSKRNAFHVCITSYNVAVTDHRAFKQKKWRYLILDEAQNIKNFKSQRWQTLLNFNSQCRLLLTGTPLQNNLMELWSLMHFLMPSVFASHTDFKEWFSNPLSGMIEGSQEYNESIVQRLHQVLRPFLLRRLKMEVEKQMPKKYEHIVPCRLSKRQRFLYDEYMSRAKTKDSLETGNYLSVINILMQLRKVCNHPDLFELRPIISPFQMEALEYCIPSCILEAIDHNPFKHVNLNDLNLKLCDYELDMDAFASFRTRQLQASRVLFADLSCLHGDIYSESGKVEVTHAPSFLEDLHVPEVTEKMNDWTASRYRHIYEVSSRRCRRSPVYGRDLIQAVKKIICHQPQKYSNDENLLPYYWLWIGYSTCHNHQTNQLHMSNMSSALMEAMPSIKSRVEQLDGIIKRFLIVVPASSSYPISLHAYHPRPSHLQQSKDFYERLKNELASYRSLLHDIVTGSCFNFPERRLIQYDCGKLQTLDILLQKLKMDDHRVLIFTQMSRMLDILEIFLNYHGLTYLRLDGSTPVQKRQYLMDRFNRDERVFCFILSTRSGGLGVNLTGADTVIFYDSDWNPTMDAQAQDRCHRIGQTRDVHIYRLICDRTVEENILKKANQKRMLGNIAIEGGAFTTDFFKQTSLRELFCNDSKNEDMENVSTVSSMGQNDHSPLLSEKQVEELLLQAEDDGDAKAASKAKAEEVAEKAEFDENFSFQDDSIKGKHVDDETAKAMSEFCIIEEQLNGIEKYAMYFLEEETAEFAAEQLRVAEENIEHAKKDWELSHLLSLREEEEKVAEEEAMDDIPLTYDRPEISNKTCREEQSGEEMPMWLPPTPPSDDTEEFYFDTVLEMQYNTQSVISPAVLASMAPFSEEDYDVFGLRRQSIDIAPAKKTSKSSSKQTKEHVNVPPSLFWRRFTADTLSTKLKKLATHQKKIKTKDQFTPLLEQQPEGPEWTVNEDWILLKSITGVLEFPISLTISVPAQIPNWSIIADITSSLGRVRRSPLQCREHLMNVVIPREDGISKGDDGTHEAKRHKSRDLSFKKSKGRKEQRTKNLVINNNSKEHTKQYSVCFDWVIQASIKRKQTPKFTWDTVQKPSMHSDLLKDYGVQLESIQSPMQTAQQRAERIQSEHPRHNIQQLLPNQPYHNLSNVVRSYSGAQIAKPAADLHIPKMGYNLPRPVISQTSQRLQNQNSASVFSPSKTITSSLSTPTSTDLSVSQVNSTSLATSLVTSLTTTVSKTLSSANTGVGDLSKTLSITRGLTSQQLLLLRQTTLHQHQQTLTTTPSTQPLGSQTQAATVQQKLSLPSGIEQLRATVASAASVLPRFAGIAATSGGAVKGLTSGRTLQTEEVLALLKQQSMRMAATQSYKASHAASVAQFNPTAGSIQLTTSKPQQTDTVKLVSSPSVIGTDGVQLKVEMMDLSQSQTSQSQTSQPLQLKPQQTVTASTTAAQIKAQIQALAAQQKVAALQTRPFSGKKQS